MQFTYAATGLSAHVRAKCEACTETKSPQVMLLPIVDGS
jgi:hypothetical protein